MVNINLENPNGQGGEEESGEPEEENFAESSSVPEVYEYGQRLRKLRGELSEKAKKVIMKQRKEKESDENNNKESNN